MRASSRRLVASKRPRKSKLPPPESIFRISSVRCCCRSIHAKSAEGSSASTQARPSGEKVRPAITSRRRGHSSAATLDSGRRDGISGSRWSAVTFTIVSIFKKVYRKRAWNRRSAVCVTDTVKSAGRCPMVCQACGNPVAADVHFCPRCGASMIAAAPVNASAKWSLQPAAVFIPLSADVCTAAAARPAEPADSRYSVVRLWSIPGHCGA